MIQLVFQLQDGDKLERTVSGSKFDSFLSINSLSRKAGSHLQGKLARGGQVVVLVKRRGVHFESLLHTEQSFRLNQLGGHYRRDFSTYASYRKTL
mmetsp:Transcript_13399/g.46718  ORF Transcript_13399/g.46718 Transcript_13399/m.46718 type:complete len:95 (+) Transcript_13399:55-339(+)